MPKRDTTRTIPMPPAAARPSVRTPWGPFEMTDSDQAARDPFEPDAPVAPDTVQPLSPRELYDMLRMPSVEPAHRNRSSPLRLHPDADPDTAKPTVEPSLNPADFPPQAELVLSALEAGQGVAPAADRRALPRRSHRSRAVLKMFSDGAQGTPFVLFTRDIHSRGLGFITQHRLPLGYGGVVAVAISTGPGEAASVVRVPCTLLRCRPAAPGWFEGSVSFVHDQPAFDQ
jgi:hypothetical protein